MSSNINNTPRTTNNNLTDKSTISRADEVAEAGPEAGAGPVAGAVSGVPIEMRRAVWAHMDGAVTLIRSTDTLWLS